MSNATEFISCFNKLQKYLEELVDPGRSQHQAFSALVERAAGTDATVRKNRDLLKDLGDLRNAIVHDRQYPHAIMAEPLPQTLAQLRNVTAMVMNPPQVRSLFMRTVKVFQAKDPVGDALRHMETNDFSQVVVWRNGGHTVLTTEGIAMWLARNASADLVSIQETLIEEVLECEPRGGYAFIGASETVDRAAEIYETPLSGNRPRLYCLVMTQNGAAKESPVGLITPWDLLKSTAIRKKG